MENDARPLQILAYQCNNDDDNHDYGDVDSGSEDEYYVDKFGDMEHDR